MVLLYYLIGDKMKDRIERIFKRIVVPIFLSILVGGVCGHIVYSIYIDSNDVVFSGKTVYVLQTGAYSNYNNMRANSLSNDYIYYEDAGMYKTLIGITQDKDNIDKIKKAYGADIAVSKYLMDDNDLYNEIKLFDNHIKNEQDEKKINDLIISMLEKYHTKKNMQLVKIE